MIYLLTTLHFTAEAKVNQLNIDFFVENFVALFIETSY